MRVLLLISIANCFVFCAAAQNTVTNDAFARTYELYSWQTASGTWNFQLLHNTSRQKTVQEVFNPKSALHGVNELKRKIAKLPTSEEVIWFDRQTLSGRKVRGSERLMYPPKEIMQDVKHEAESHGVKVSGPDETS